MSSYKRAFIVRHYIVVIIIHIYTCMNTVTRNEERTYILLYVNLTIINVKKPKKKKKFPRFEKLTYLPIIVQ